MDWLTSEEIKAIGDFKKGVSHGLGENLKRLRLFGSKARGDYERESDLDVLVLVSERSYKIDRQITDVSADVMCEYLVRVSPFILTEEQYNMLKSLERRIIRDIEEEGVDL
ncbi:MAG: hypothetical protein A2X87_03890 [Deltaproteobacteria bacterium GWC2_42_51]|nr:MAG: hypothetical protein A2067_07235 [Deltaproteobacteria bacterium GWB2_42_7]OGP34880.1 MAG: hypothetical protein A2X87_03890 [Deltaproteobacteria bacterium GWC2_42_51]OGP42586.1 MAG: hypothetical protein A2090_07635 [Deltaproteobacteria bacterium GWD2_42_10]OGP46948.1 MAG: hypothetical protein A2022_10555 [Deltaproteobacteria bacterium GWF2_42_12]OGQ23870.1 MAG: hypothetical protein A3D29_01970 [Deltaproteobacteria bacterium RIFCSPHIGHO2_02_FULL_42_44]OGQ37103.1 MAG: hypothetical protein